MRDHYHGHAAARYDRVWAEFTRRSLLPVRTQVLEFAPASARILDVGCGTGMLLAWLAETRPDLRLWGTDESTAMLAQAAQRVGDQVQLMPWNLNAPPPAALDTLVPFDIILCTNVLHYVTNPQHAMEYFAQLLTPGGTVLVSDYIRHGWWWPLFEGIIHLADQAHHRTLTASAIERITTQATFAVTKTLTISAGGPWHGVLVKASLRERTS